MYSRRDLLDAARRLVQSKCSRKPRIAIILGSGLGGLGDEVEDSTSIPFGEIAGFPTASAAGHRGRLILGTLSGIPVVVMQGRGHLYEGHAVETVTFPVRLMRELGAEILLVSNASGGINPRFSSGEIVLIDSHIDWMATPQLRPGGDIEVPNRHGEAYDSALQKVAIQIALDSGFSLAKGTYLATLGPNYETGAEYRFFRFIGADMVGMSTVPEVLVAVELGFRVLGFSVVTNVAKPDQLTKTDHNDVLDWAKVAQDRLLPLVKKLVASI